MAATSSTLDLAQQALSQGRIGLPALVLAARQTCGKGSHGRRFASPAGGLYLTVCLEHPTTLERAPLCSLVAAVVAAECVEAAAPVRVALKWPNDLYLGQRKLGGLLLQQYAAGDLLKDRAVLLVGVGVNVLSRSADFPADLRAKVVSMYDASGVRADIMPLARCLGEGLLQALADAAQNWSTWLDRYRRREMMAGRRVRCRREDGTWRLATAVGVDDEGRYVLQWDSGGKAAFHYAHLEIC